MNGKLAHNGSCGHTLNVGRYSPPAVVTNVWVDGLSNKLDFLFIFFYLDLAHSLTLCDYYCNHDNVPQTTMCPLNLTNPKSEHCYTITQITFGFGR